MNKRQLGTEYETKTISWLEKQNFEILEHSYRCRQGEIDLIGMDHDTLAFIEVKYRTSTRYGFPEEAVNRKKQVTICRVSDYYRFVHHIMETQPIRYDVVAICGEEIKWYKNAFWHVGGI